MHKIIRWIAVICVVLLSIDHAIPQACNNTIPVVVDGVSGSLTSPGYPNTFVSGLDCLYNITVPVGYTMKLTFVDFHLKDKVNSRCIYSDFLQTHDSIAANHLNPTEELCGPQHPGSVYSKTNWIKLRFHSVSSNQFRGFNITFEAITEKQICPKNELISKRNGSITSPYYPRYFPARMTCTWRITAPKGSHLMVKVLDFDILDCGYSCNCGYLEVSIGETSSQRSQKLCQNGLNDDFDLRKPFYSIRNNIWLAFRSYNESFTNHKGFLVTFEQIAYTPPVCPDAPYNLTDNHGSFSSPNYPMQYPTNINCLWLITVSPGSNIHLNFTELKLEEKVTGYDKCFDWLKLYSGPSKSSGLIGQFCEPILQGPLVSNGNQMLIEFFSGNTGVAKGFHAEYTTTPTVTKEPTTSSSSNLLLEKGMFTLKVTLVILIFTKTT